MNADGSQSCDDSIPLLLSDTRRVRDNLTRIHVSGHFLDYLPCK